MGNKPKATRSTSKTGPNSDRLMPKEVAFAHEYIIDFNATQSVIRAGYQTKTPKVTGYALLKKARVIDYIQTLKAERCKVAELTVDMIVGEMKRIAFFDVRKLFDNDGRPIALQDLDDDTAAVIAGLDVFEEWGGPSDERQKVGEVRKWKLANKMDALINLGRYKGMFEDKIKITSSMSDDELLKLAAGIAARNA